MCVWPSVILKNCLAELQSGNREKGGALSSGIPSLGAEHLNAEGGFNLRPEKLKYISEEFFTGLKRGRIQRGDVLIVKDGATTGKTAFVGDDFPFERAAVNEHVFLMRVKPSLRSDFLFYYLRSSVGNKRVMENFHGATVGGITKDFVNIALPLPPLDEQARIVATLDAVAATLKKRQTQLAELDALIQARFVELFGDPATNPKGWPTGTIRDIVSEVKYGTSKPATVDGRFNYLRMNNITYDGYLDLSDLKKIDVPEAEVEKYIVRKNDVLFNRTNSKELVGKTCVFDADEPMIIAGYIIRVRVNEKATPLFLSRFLNSRYGKTTLFNMCKAIVGQANINAQELQKIAIFIPPLALQERFAAEVERVEAVKTSVRAGIAETRTLFDALSQRYFG